MYKLIATDFDDTLLTDDKKVSNYTKKVLLKYKNDGYLIVGASARPLDVVNSFMDINMFDYLLLNNGAVVYDISNDVINIIDQIDIKVAENIKEKYKNIYNNIVYCSYDNYYVNKYDSKYTSDKKYNIKMEDILKDRPILRINLLFDNDFNFDSIISDINSNYPGILAFTMRDSKSDGKIITIMPKGVNKANTLKILGNNLNINLDEMIYFGDGLNDLEIINKVGLGVAMINALDEIKEKSKDITKYDNNNDGVVKYLEEKIKEEKK